MARKELKKKPLVEAIFELKWDIPAQTSNLAGDPNYKLLLGRFFDRIRERYPAHEELPSAQLPDGMVPHVAQHRFRTSKASWPLVQIGHGVMTVNDTEDYRWDDFRKRSEDAFKALFESHPDSNQFQIKDLMLRYIDAIPVDFAKENMFDFLRSKMKTNIELPKGLFENGSVNPNPMQFQWQTSFPTESPGGSILLKYSSGKSKDQPALILETRVHTPREQLPTMPDEFDGWLQKAHALTDDWFFELIEGELEERFS